jgi:phenylpropionate dioxygenase-like ring-hydroxylating dioxygenase large terminal subunit
MAMPLETAGERVRVAPLETLLEKGRHLFKAGGKQIAVFAGDGGVFACNNRCPHEGYPLMEGKLSPASQGGGCAFRRGWRCVGSWKLSKVFP